jgi:hypothetical protein
LAWAPDHLKGVKGTPFRVFIICSLLADVTSILMNSRLCKQHA